MGYPRLVEYLKQGWRFIYEPDTRFIGIKHDRGGRQNLCEVSLRQPLRDQIGHELANLIHNAMVPTDATHVQTGGPLPRRPGGPGHPTRRPWRPRPFGVRCRSRRCRPQAGWW